MNRPSQLPPGQQLVAPEKWPQVGERLPAPSSGPWTIALADDSGKEVSLTLDQLRQFPFVEQSIDIHCVTRWSKPAVQFGGFLLADLLKQTGFRTDGAFVSFVAHSERAHNTSLLLHDALELGTLLAVEHDCHPLAVEHGGPVRVVVPNRYFYKSLKWLRRIELRADECLGYWEANAGYHNTADPWREQRFIAPSIDRKLAAEILRTRQMSGLELMGLNAEGRELSGLQARGTLLRHARFGHCILADADFTLANLSNAQFSDTDLRGATFREADLEGADFAGADLRRVDFTGAHLSAATFFSGLRAAIIDSTTQFEPSSVEELMPEQQAFIHDRLQFPRP